MEFLDEDARPRVVFQSRTVAPSSPADPETQQTESLNKPFLAITISISSLMLALSIFFIQNEPFKSLLFWVSTSLLIGPLAPSHITGGDIRVGQGPILEPLDPEPEVVTEKRAPKRRSKAVRSEDTIVNQTPAIDLGQTNGSSSRKDKVESASNEEEKDWSEEDFTILKKQMAKNPVGKPRRWEVIAEAFNGRHRVDSVIKAAKELGEKKSDDSDSYAKFLKNRKPVDARVEAAELDEGGAENGGGGAAAVTWSSGEDIALLNALKAFPKDVAMRWDKVAAAVPGKSKAACVKRVSDLKKGFRSSKTGAAAN